MTNLFSFNELAHLSPRKADILSTGAKKRPPAIADCVDEQIVTNRNPVCGVAQSSTRIATSGRSKRLAKRNIANMHLTPSALSQTYIYRHKATVPSRLNLPTLNFLAGGTFFSTLLLILPICTFRRLLQNGFWQNYRQ